MSVSITVENMDADVLDRLQAEAMRRGMDVSALIKQMLREKLRPAVSPNSSQTHHDLDALAGTWSSNDAEEFRDATAEMNDIDEDAPQVVHETAKEREFTRIVNF